MRKISYIHNKQAQWNDKCTVMLLIATFLNIVHSIEAENGEVIVQSASYKYQMFTLHKLDLSNCLILLYFKCGYLCCTIGN